MARSAAIDRARSEGAGVVAVAVERKWERGRRDGGEGQAEGERRRRRWWRRWEERLHIFGAEIEKERGWSGGSVNPSKTLTRSRRRQVGFGIGS